MKHAAAFLLLALSPVASHAADSRDDPIHDEETRIDQRFCADAKTTVDYNACSGKALTQAQADLTATSDAALAKWRDSPETVSALKRAQSAWKASFEADVAARFAAADAERARGGWAGSAYLAAHAFYEAQLTRARTAQLCEFLRGAAYGERKTASCDELVEQVLNEQKK